MPEFPFSNFQPAEVELDGLRYPTVEHAYQAAKTLDPMQRVEVRLATSPGRAKRLGQHVTKRPDWEEIKVATMMALLRQKFALGTPAARQLELYQGTIVEWNSWHDNFWGICTCQSCPKIGQNQLGKLLEQLRRELRHAQM